MSSRSDVSDSLEKALSGVNYFALVLIVMTANLGMMLFGYEVGATSWMIYNIESYSSLDDNSYAFYKIVSNNSLLVGIVAASCSLGAVISYGLLIFWANTISKNIEISFAAVFYCVGAVLQSESEDMDWSSYGGFVLLIVGRFLYGIGIALTVHSVPQYVSEVTPANIRGNFGATVEAMVMSGMSLGFVVGYITDSDGWRTTFEVAYLIAIVMFLGSLVFPPSLVWMYHNAVPPSEIVASLKFLYPHINVGAVENMQELVAADERERERRLHGALKRSSVEQAYFTKLFPPQIQVLFSDRSIHRGFLLKLSINIFKILTGQTVILYYLATILSQIFSTTNEVEFYSLLYILIRLIVSYIMVFVVDLCGRRVWLVMSTFLLFATQLLVFFGFLYGNSALELFIFGAGMGYQMGLGSVSYFLQSEVVPFYVRSTANAIANLVLFTFYFLSVFLFPYTLDNIGIDYIFLAISGISLLSLYFVYYYIPETRGLPLDETHLLVDEKFDSAPQLCCCCCCSESAVEDYSQDPEFDALKEDWED